MYTRLHSRFRFYVGHLNQTATLAADQNWTLPCFYIFLTKIIKESYKNWATTLDSGIKIGLRLLIFEKF